MSTAPADQAEPGAGELIRHEMGGLDRLKNTPIIDTVDPRTLTLIQKQIAPNCSHAEIGHFLELCAHYELDPFAKEAWCAKGDKPNSKLLIMVGRDGLRKIAQRNGLHVDGDVVRQNDEFTICRTPDGNRTVTHSYANPAKRGDIVGAWAECRDGGPMGRPMGYFYAPLEEYRPKGASDYSPWSKQVGVMILAAAERQAIRQATPLGGLLAIGEDELVRENERPSLGDGQGDGQAAGLDLGPEVERIIARAEALGHAGYASRGTIEIQVGGQPPEVVARWVANADRELDEVPVDAVVVPEAAQGPVPSEAAQAGEDKREGDERPQEPPAAPEASESRPRVRRDPDAVERMRAHAMELADYADSLEAEGKTADAERARDDATTLMAEVDAATDPAQESLL